MCIKILRISFSGKSFGISKKNVNKKVKSRRMQKNKVINACILNSSKLFHIVACFFFFQLLIPCNFIDISISLIHF